LIASASSRAFSDCPWFLGATIFRLEFKAATEAEAFARAFGGQVIADERIGAVAA
jgi:hypothetical protein